MAQEPSASVEKPATALLGQDNMFQTLADESPNMIFINLAGKVVYANRLCEQILGYTREEICSPKFNFLDIIAPEYHGITYQNLKAHGMGKEVAPLEYVIITRDGTRIPAVISTKLISVQGQKGILGIVTDISTLKNTEAQLRQFSDQVMAQKKALEEKNIALRELLSQVESEKDQFRDRITASVDRLLMPTLRKLQARLTGAAARHAKVLEASLQQLTSRFGVEMAHHADALSPREIEICNMIKNNFSSKEIADALHISVQTVNTLRNRIRKKLGLRNKKANLASHLQSIR